MSDLTQKNISELTNEEIIEFIVKRYYKNLNKGLVQTDICQIILNKIDNLQKEQHCIISLHKNIDKNKDLIMCNIGNVIDLNDYEILHLYSFAMISGRYENEEPKFYYGTLQDYMHYNENVDKLNKISKWYETKRSKIDIQNLLPVITIQHKNKTPFINFRTISNFDYKKFYQLEIVEK